MDLTPSEPETQESSTASAAAQDADVIESAQRLWQELCQLSQDQFLLAALEARRAGESLVDMLVAGVMVAILMSTAWLGFMAALVLGLIEQGLLTSTAILLAVAGNVLLAVLLCGIIRYKRHYLQFPATCRSVQAKTTVKTAVELP